MESGILLLDLLVIWASGKNVPHLLLSPSQYLQSLLMWSKSIAYRVSIHFAIVRGSVHHFKRYMVFEGWNILFLPFLLMLQMPYV